MKKKKAGRVLLSFLLTLVMVVGLMPVMGLTAYAEGAVSYVYYTVSGTTVTKHTDGSCATYTTLANDTTTWNEGWYVVPAGSVTIVSRITVSDTVNLILTDGATLTATKGIDVPGTATLNIYAQNGETGTLFAGTENGTTATLTASDKAAGIGGGLSDNTGSINIHGGKITAMGGYAPGIGGGYYKNYGGTIVIYGGEINATAGSQSAGIGSASGNAGGSVTIYGGTINASSSQMAPGIGSGRDDKIGVDVTIYGGIINAQGGNEYSGGTGIGAGYHGKCGNITINGGTVTAIGGVDDSGQGGPGIGGGESGTGIGNIVINGGTVTAIGKGGSAGIGGFRSYSGSAGANVTINGGTVIASGSTVEGTGKTMDWDTYVEIDITYSYTGVAIGGSSYKDSNNTNNIGQNGNLTLGEGCYLYGGASESPENDLSNYLAGAGSYTDDRYLYMTVNSVAPKSEQTSTVTDSSDSGSGSSSSSSSDNTNTNTDTSAKVPYEDVAISTGSVIDITGTAAATAESNPFETKIENNDKLTTLLALTPQEVAQGVNVWLDIQDMSATVPQAEKDIVQNASDNYIVGMYLDINLFKKVGGNTATKITETNGTVKASILIPESLWKAGRTFEIIRVHDGVPTVISGTYDENTHVFTFETDKFSTYALAYKDPASSSDSSNNTQSTTPETGDPNDIRVWYLLLLASLGGLGFLGLSKKKES